MADGELTLNLDDATLARLREEADAVGRPVEDYAASLITTNFDDRWASSLEALAEYDRTGVSYSLEEGMAVFDAAVERRLARKA